MTWFYFMCGLSLTILISDARGTLESTVKKWEQKLGIPVYYPPDDSLDVDISNPYPMQDMPQQDTFNSQRQNNESRS
jgi:hypothetical protein